MNELTLFDQLAEIIKPFDQSLIDRFHNTTNLSGDDLKEHQVRNESQNRKVLKFFKTHSYENYIAFEVWKALGINNCPKSSIQRSMTDLTPEYLTKLDGKEGRPLVQRPGEWKELCFARILR